MSSQSHRSDDGSSFDDVVLLCSPTADGGGVKALRARRDRLELAEIRPLREGQPIIAGEVARLRPRKEMPLVCDVEVAYEVPSPPADTVHAGPPRISSRTYRQNWDNVFKPHQISRTKKQQQPN